MHPTATPEAWRAARLELLAAEKAFNRERDALSAARRALPWVRIEKPYVFATETGAASLPDLFSGNRQLIVYHFMFGSDWQEGCPSCSFWADNFQGIGIHLAHRDTALIAVSKAPLDKLLAYRTRMGWTFPWVSSAANTFNEDFNVTFPDGAEGEYNYAPKRHNMTELPGISVFIRDGDAVYHSYSTYARGLDMLNGAYHFLDLTALGRHEEGLDHTMSWLRRHDRY